MQSPQPSLNGYKQLQQLVNKNTMFNFATGKFSSSKNKTEDLFIPFINERGNFGKLRNSTSQTIKKKHSHQIPKINKSKDSNFLRDAFRTHSTFKQDLNNAQKNPIIILNDPTIFTSKETQNNENSTHFDGFFKKNSVIDSRRKFFSQRQSPQNSLDSGYRNTCALGKQISSNQVNPPIGYYSNQQKSFQPMLVFMDRNQRRRSTHDPVQEKLIREEVKEEKYMHETKKDQQRKLVEQLTQMLQVPPEKVQNIQKLEEQLCKQKFRFTPKVNYLDPNVFVDFTNAIDQLKRKIRTLKYELSSGKKL